ncbi:MAG TPA: hypothetical protein VET24_01915 [Actinomycetota bacterium]|nr:hypothetical protein [Actinomycetota bacterium]
MQSGSGWRSDVQRKAEPRRRHPVARILGMALPVMFVAAMVAISAATGHGAGPDSSLVLRAAADVNTNNSSFTYVPGRLGSAISSKQFHKGAPGILTLSVYGMPPQPGDTSATIYADLSNGTGQTAHFNGGPTVAVAVLHNGKPFRTLTLTQPAVTTLAAGQALDLQASVPLAGAGTYALSAELVGVGANPAFTLSAS